MMRSSLFCSSTTTRTCSSSLAGFHHCRNFFSSSSSSKTSSLNNLFCCSSPLLSTSHRFVTNFQAPATPGTTRHPKTRRGEAAAHAFRGMLGPQGYAESMQPNAVPIPGRATPEGTIQTMLRSNTFENWHHVCEEPVGWAMSKLGCATCKMAKDLHESSESIQLQIIKGLNVFEIDASIGEVYQNINRAVTEVLSAFELDRNGIIFMVRGGIMRQPANQKDERSIEINNLAPIRARMSPVIERYKAASLPSMQLKTMMNFEEMDDAQLTSMNLRRVSIRSAACLTPDWLEAIFTTLEYHLQMECMDVFLLEGMHTLYDNRPEAEIDQHIVDLFKFLEQQVKDRIIQYFGVSSPNLAPPLPRVYPPIPDNAEMPEKYLKPIPTPVTISLHKLMELAQRACDEVYAEENAKALAEGGSGSSGSNNAKVEHHLRFISYPFNLTQSQALYTPLPYEPTETLVSLAKKLKLTAVGYSPIEAPDLQEKTNRYHKFNAVTNLSQARMHFLNTAERIVQKEIEIKPYIEKMGNPPKIEHLFVGSVYACVQNQISNYFQFNDWVTYDVLPQLRTALVRLREGSVKDIKDWASSFEQLCLDMIRFRLQLLEHRMAQNSYRIEANIDRLAPHLKKCPIYSQKALNFATHGADVLCAGFHQTRYFHEATDLNPLKGDHNRIPEDQLRALCSSLEVSFCNYNPPHPYMLAKPLKPERPIIKNKKHQLLQGQGNDYLLPIDPKNPQWPDCHGEIQEDKKFEADLLKEIQRELNTET